MAAAGIVVSVSMGVMKPVLAKLTTLMGDEYKKLKGLRKEVSFLQRELSAMNVLLERMDAADELDPQAKNWRKDIIEMSYDIEDCIDDFMDRVGEADENKMGILQKASQYLRTFKDRRRLATQFNEIKTLVIEASERRRRYMLDQCISITTPVVVDPRFSALYKESASLVGIDTLKDELVKWVMDEKKQLKVMSIVGFGGLGKTTLANEVYREVGGQFDCKAFVFVSQKPEMIRLFNSLLSQLELGTYSHACQVQDPINDLIKHLQDKRYFIVVDDLWDIRAWDTIRCAFPQNSQHSRVVITTRNEDVARACCGNDGFIHKMKPLSEQDSRTLFFNRIFGSENDCPSQFTEISCEILKKCGGLPLAIITVASILACQPTKLKEQWEYIWNSLATKFARNLTTLEDMMHILDLSYKNLPPNLKACFLYLGTYPEDHKISRAELVRRWVAEGFVSGIPRLNLWEVADIYFTELVNRSMVQPTYDFWDIEVVSGCRVHDMMLDLIVRRCKEDNFLILANDTRAVAKDQDKVIRRLTVDLRIIEGGTTYMNSSRNLSQIRSLAIFGGTKWMPPLLELRFVRVLFLYFTELVMGLDLTGISELSQLRYLNVQGSWDCNIVLPGKLRGLRLFETLELPLLSKCNIPSDIVDVPRLSHLVVPMGTRLPDGIGKVKSLRTLRGFSLAEGSLESIIGLGELTALSELVLDQYMWSGPLPSATWMAALGACLEKLGNLKLLSAVFTGVAYCADALSSLSPPFRNLERLRLQGFTFSRVPRWIGHLGNLRELRLGAKQILQEDVAIIGTRLLSLVYLSLRILCIPMERIVIAGSMGFALLKLFAFNCDGISHLTFEAGAMPELRELELTFHPYEWDKATPIGLRHLPSLEEIHVWRARYHSDRRLDEANEDETKETAEVIRGVFQETAGALLTRPALIFDDRSWMSRLDEKE